MSNFNDGGWQPQAGDTKPKQDTSEVVRFNTVVMWAELTRKNALSDKYQVVLTQISDAAADKLAEIGVKVMTREDKADYGNYITVKSIHEMVAFDNNGEIIEDLIGNGSKAIVKVGAYEWKGQYGKGISPTLKRLTITELIPYEGSGSGDSGEDGDIL